MQDRQTLRKKLGLSQDQLASYLGVTRSHVNMIERHQRSGSTAILQKKFWLESAVKTPGNQISAGMLQQINQLNKKERDNLNKLRSNCLHKIVQLQRKLSQLQEAYQQALLLLQVITTLRNNNEALQTDDTLTLWLDITEREALQKLKKTSLAKQALLKVKIKALTAESNELAIMML